MTPPVYTAKMAAEAVRLYAGPKKLSPRGVIQRWRAAGRHPLPSEAWVRDCARRAGVIRTRSAGTRNAFIERAGLDYEALERRARELERDWRHTKTTIARMLGISRRTVGRWLPRDGERLAAESLRRGRVQRARNREMRLRALELRAERFAYSAIAAELNVDKSTLTRWFREAGMQTGCRGRKNP